MIFFEYINDISFILTSIVITAPIWIPALLILKGLNSKIKKGNPCIQVIKERNNVSAQYYNNRNNLGSTRFKEPNISNAVIDPRYSGYLGNILYNK